MISIDYNITKKIRKFFTTFQPIIRNIFDDHFNSLLEINFYSLLGNLLQICSFFILIYYISNIEKIEILIGISGKTNFLFSIAIFVFMSLIIFGTYLTFFSQKLSALKAAKVSQKLTSNLMIKYWSYYRTFNKKSKESKEYFLRQNLHNSQYHEIFSPSKIIIINRSIDISTRMFLMSLPALLSSLIIIFVIFFIQPLISLVLSFLIFLALFYLRFQSQRSITTRTRLEHTQSIVASQRKHLFEVFKKAEGDESDARSKAKKVIRSPEGELFSELAARQFVVNYETNFVMGSIAALLVSISVLMLPIVEGQAINEIPASVWGEFIVYLAIIRLLGGEITRFARMIVGANRMFKHLEVLNLVLSLKFDDPTPSPQSNNQGRQPLADAKMGRDDSPALLVIPQEESGQIEQQTIELGEPLVFFSPDFFNILEAGYLSPEMGYSKLAIDNDMDRVAFANTGKPHSLKRSRVLREELQIPRSVGADELKAFVEGLHINFRRYFEHLSVLDRTLTPQEVDNITSFQWFMFTLWEASFSDAGTWVIDAFQVKNWAKLTKLDKSVLIDILKRNKFLIIDCSRPQAIDEIQSYATTAVAGDGRKLTWVGQAQDLEPAIIQDILHAASKPSSSAKNAGSDPLLDEEF